MSKKIKSPCVSLCHLKHDICTGCGRSKFEIKDWKSMKYKEQKVTVERAAVRMSDLCKKNKKH